MVLGIPPMTAVLAATTLVSLVRQLQAFCVEPGGLENYGFSTNRNSTLQDIRLEQVCLPPRAPSCGVLLVVCDTGFL